MATYKFLASGSNIEDRQDCPAGHVRFCFRVGQDAAPRDITHALLSCDADPDVPALGPYPAKIGAHWSDQPSGRAGYYVLVGPVPEADLPADMQADCRCMDACLAFDA
jgi:hypothetical protein